MGFFKSLANAARKANASYDAKIARMPHTRDYDGEEIASSTQCCANCRHLYRDYVYGSGVEGKRYQCHNRPGETVVFNESDVDNGILRRRSCSYFESK